MGEYIFDFGCYIIIMKNQAVMKKNILIVSALTAIFFSLTSCSGLLMSTDFGFDDYGPSYDYYWPNYGNIYNPPLGYYGPAWGAPIPPGPPVINRPVSRPLPPNGANRPNYVPSAPSNGNNQSRPPVSTSPSGQTRPGNMGMPSSNQNPQSKPASGNASQRGR